MNDKDYYKILGISKDASVDEIKKAYRKQAFKHHPDQGGDEAKFKEINEAHEVLSNPEKKQRYDQFGSAGLGGQGGAGGFSSAEGFNFDFGGGGFGDLFDSFFGGGARRAQRQQARDIEIGLDLDFEEAVFGVTKTISLTINDVCDRCNGQRAQPGSKVTTCTTCDGKGRRVTAMRTVFGNIQQETICPACRGEGNQIKEPCKTCAGEGIRQQQRDLEVEIPAGIGDGMTIRLPGHGEKNRQGAAGSLYVVVSIRPHRHFTREGSLILSEQSISLTEAALGTTIAIETVDGSVKLKIPAGTQGGTDFRLKNHGVSHLKGSGRGDHIVRINVTTPTKLSSAQKKLLADFQKLEK